MKWDRVINRSIRIALLCIMMGAMLGMAQSTVRSAGESLLILVDDFDSNGIIQVHTSGEPNTLQIEVKNSKSYWTNLRISQVGIARPQPADLLTQFCDDIGVIPPGETLRYKASFSLDGQSATFSADLTTVTGRDAALFNTATALLKILSPVASIGGENDIPIIIEIVKTIPKFAGVAYNLAHGDLYAAASDLLEILNTYDNRVTIATCLAGLQWCVQKQVSGGQILSSLNTITHLKSLISVLWQEANIIWDATLGHPAGSVMVKATALNLQCTLTTSVITPDGGFVTPSGLKHKCTFQEGELSVTSLTAWPASGYVFNHWEGAASGNSPETIVNLDGNQNATAYFTKITMPDLTVSPVLFDPPIATIEQPINATFTVKNTGYSDSGPFHIRVFLSPQNEGGITYSLGYFPMDSLGPGVATEPITIITDPTPTNVPVGEYYVTVWADALSPPDGEVAESNEDNNIGNSTPERIHIGTYILNTTVVGADAVWQINLSSPAIFTTPLHLYDSFTVGANVLWRKGLTNPSINTSPSRIYNSFAVGANALWQKTFTNPNIDTVLSHIYNAFVVGANALWSRTLKPMESGVPETIQGDATGDGTVDAVDITKVERIIAGLDAATSGADANLDGSINALDITKVERIIAELD